MSRWGEIELVDDMMLFVDDDLVAVDKPAGVLCDASRDPERDHLGAALGRWASQSSGHPADGGFLPAHRLDVGTSGVVLFAKNKQTATGLMHQFQERTVTKRYQAVVRMPAEATWAIGDTFERRSYLRHRGGVSTEVRSGGKPAQTQFEVADVSDRLALVSATPRTGRTHQLRVHLSALGAPIVGDDRYGGISASRLWLHAESLEVVHPTSGSPLRLKSRHRLELVAGHPHNGKRVD